MFGKNVILKQERTNPDGKLAVQNIFYTLQGEGPFSGCPAVFIRLAGCHLACTFCDTEFDSGINNRMSVEDIVLKAISVLPGQYHQRPLVVLTGGEPLRQNTAPLVHALREQGFLHVQYETAGNLWEPELAMFFGLANNRFVTFVVSPKTPHVHPEVCARTEHWKYVVRAGGDDGGVDSDGLPSIPTQANYPPPATAGLARPWWTLDDSVNYTIWLSPCDEYDPAKNARNRDLAVQTCLKHGYRLSLQTHKLVNLP